MQRACATPLLLLFLVRMKVWSKMVCRAHAVAMLASLPTCGAPGTRAPQTTQLPPLANAPAASTPPSASIAWPACEAHPPETDTTMLVGLVIPFPYDHLAAPWRPSDDWTVGGNYYIEIAHAGGHRSAGVPDDQIAFVVAKDEWTPHGHIRRTLGALGVGDFCWDTVISTCAVNGVDDPWVFARIAGTIDCVDHPIPAARAWRAKPDGTITEIAADDVTCENRTCD